MDIPGLGVLPAILANSAQRAVTPIARRLSGTLLNATFNPLTRELDYQTNMRIPNTVPPLEELINLAYSQMITPADLDAYASFWGAQLGRGPRVIEFNLPALGNVLNIPQRITISGVRHTLWRNVLENNRPHYGLDMLLMQYRQGQAGAEARLRDALKKDGFPTAAQQDVFVRQVEQEAASTIITAWLLRLLNDDDTARLLAKLGYDGPAVGRMMDSTHRKLSPQEAVVWWNRGVLSETDARDCFRFAGFISGLEQKPYELSRFIPPDMATLIAANDRQGFGDRFAIKWGLDEGKTGNYSTWATRMGLDTPVGVGPYGEPDASAKTLADLIYRNHWQLPSIGLLAQIIHRFRGDPNDPSTWSQPGYPPLTQGEIQDAMQAQGIPTLMQNYLGRLVFNPFPIRYINLAAQSGTVNVQWVQSKLLDNGYFPPDAATMANAIMTNAANKANASVVALRKKAWSGLIRSVEQAYEAGAIDNAAASAQLVSNGVPQDTAAILLGTVDITAATGIVRQLTSRTRSDFYAGKITQDDAARILISANMDAQRVQQIVSSWIAAFSERRKHMATGQILRLLRKGLMTKAQALVRLDNLGWRNPDDLLLIAEVEGEIAKDHAAAIKSLDESHAKQERQALATFGKLQAMAGKLLSRLKTLTPPKDVVKWYVDGVWSEAKARDRLTLLGFDADTIDTMFLDALHKGSKKTTKGASGGTGP